MMESLEDLIIRPELQLQGLQAGVLFADMGEADMDRI